MNKNLSTFIESFDSFKECIHISKEECKEKDKVIAVSEKEIVHIRIDECVICGNTQKKCDCLVILYEEDLFKLFFIERKDGNPIMVEVQCQIQKTIDYLEPSLAKHRNKIKFIPVVCAKKFPNDINKILPSYRVKLFGKPFTIQHINWGINIITKIKY
jgi:hypothetical protein